MWQQQQSTHCWHHPQVNANVKEYKHFSLVWYKGILSRKVENKTFLRFKSHEEHTFWLTLWNSFFLKILFQQIFPSSFYNHPNLCSTDIGNLKDENVSCHIEFVFRRSCKDSILATTILTTLDTQMARCW